MRGSMTSDRYVGRSGMLLCTYIHKQAPCLDFCSRSFFPSVDLFTKVTYWMFLMKKEWVTHTFLLTKEMPLHNTSSSPAFPFAYHGIWQCLSTRIQFGCNRSPIAMIEQLDNHWQIHMGWCLHYWLLQIGIWKGQAWDLSFIRSDITTSNYIIG